MNASPAPARWIEPPRVMLLSLWAASDSAWRARLVDTDACVHDFESPFELARFLARQDEAPPAQCAPAGGLR